MEQHDFVPSALAFTQRLVRWPSVSRTDGERGLGTLICSMLEEIGRGVLTTGLFPISGDPWGRCVPWALLHGTGPRTVVLISHYDTVSTLDYGLLQDVATEPEELRARLARMDSGLGDLALQHLQSDEWLWGRGTVDMKGGIAAHLAVLEYLCARARQGEALNGSVLFVSTPDEEVESAGILAATELLLTLREEHGLEYQGAINTDYITEREPGDESKPVYAGVVGKLLPSVYIRGVETHVGEPYGGVDANLLLAEMLISLSTRAELADATGDGAAVPPVSLKATDLKGSYDVQVPFEAYMYLNYLTYAAQPADVLARIRGTVEEALRVALHRVFQSHREWARAAGRSEPVCPYEASVVTYSELLRLAEAAHGRDAVRQRLSAAEDAHPPENEDARLRSLHPVRELWNLSGLRGPGAVVYLSPPYYPHSSGAESPLVRAAACVAEEHGAGLRRYYPYVSDASYLRLEDSSALDAVRSNMPLWSDRPTEGMYSLPLDRIRELNLDVVNIGVWGYGAHKREERLHVPYGCGTVPKMVLETVRRTLDEA